MLTFWSSSLGSFHWDDRWVESTQLHGYFWPTHPPSLDTASPVTDLFPKDGVLVQRAHTTFTWTLRPQCASKTLRMALKKNRISSFWNFLSVIRGFHIGDARLGGVSAQIIGPDRSQTFWRARQNFVAASPMWKPPNATTRQTKGTTQNMWYAMAMHLVSNPPCPTLSRKKGSSPSPEGQRFKSCYQWKTKLLSRTRVVVVTTGALL